jgi:putative arylsulfatase
MVTAEQQMVYDNAAQRVVYRAGNGAAQPFEAAGKAYLQELYNDIAKR